jgi:hypothetical protein
MSNNAVGLEQVGGVSQAAKGMVENSDSRVQAAKKLQSVSEATNGRMVGPAGDMMRNAMDTNSGASGMAGVRGAEVATSFAHGEKSVVQGTTDSLQQQKVSSQEGENTFQHLTKSIEA